VSTELAACALQHFELYKGGCGSVLQWFTIFGVGSSNMTNEEMQRTMDFIVQQQAQTSVKIEALTETQNRAEERWAQTENGIRALLAIAEMHERELQSHTQQIQSHTQQILSIGENAKATDERLNALINVVERQISNGRHGN
jgi:hypothetical protein